MGPTHTALLFYFTMEDETNSLSVKCVGYVLMQRVGKIDTELQVEDISKIINLYMAIMCVHIHGDNVCAYTWR
jgi:hypothetical protein